MFKLVSKFKPTGDQPQAIKKLVKNLKEGEKHQVLLGVTGSGKTYTMASVIEKIKKPVLIISHNKTLAAQLYQEFKEFFPENAVHYFVSYYDYYQPEAYIPQTDTYIEKDAKINQEIDRLRHAAVQDILNRKDVIVVASVSCIYNIGSPQNYQKISLEIKKEQKIKRRDFISHLISLQYQRNDIDFKPGTFRVRGDIVEIFAVTGEKIIRVEFFRDKIERIFISEPPLSKNYKRLEQRTNYDLEMLKESGYCHGIENYSRHLEFREPGKAPFTLLDYLSFSEHSDASSNHSDRFLVFIDESHMTIPQLRAMYNTDKARKEVLVEHGFRLPSAFDNRPLNFSEFEKKATQVIYVSATPGPYEMSKIKNRRRKLLVEQLIRPTGLLEPSIEIRPTHNQVKDLVEEIKKRVRKKQRTLAVTLTKRLAEELSVYLQEQGILTNYLHSEVKTLERPEILSKLRKGEYDVIVGINLLREGLDLPEVSLVAILDADKEGFLRSETTLIQTMGRAARHIEGHVILYADKITTSIKKAIEEIERRRKIQKEYNKKHKITPSPIVKEIREWTFGKKEKDTAWEFSHIQDVKLLEKEMKKAADNLDFERAALLRDLIKKLKS